MESGGELARCLLNLVAYASLHALIPSIGARLGVPRLAGLLAGLAMALVPIHKSAEVMRGWDEPYSALAFAGLLVWTAALWEEGWQGRFNAVKYGLCWGLLFHAAPTTVLTYAGLGAVACYRAVRSAPSLRWWLISTATIGLVLIPWTLRNHDRMGQWMFMRSNLGLELQQAYNDLAQPTVALNRLTGSVSTHPLFSADERRRVALLGEVAYNRSKRQEAFSWIKDHPGRFVQLTIGHIQQFWLGWFETPGGLTFVFTATTFLAWAGLWRMFRNGATVTAQVLLISWVTFPTVYYFFQYVNRYRVVIDWSFTLIAAYFIHEAVLVPLTIGKPSLRAAARLSGPVVEPFGKRT